MPVPLWCPVILTQTLGRRKVLLTRNLSGKGHGHQKERQAHRNELDDFIQWQIQLQVSNAIVPITVPQQGIREHRLGGHVGDRHAGNCGRQQKRPNIFLVKSFCGLIICAVIHIDILHKICPLTSIGMYKGQLNLSNSTLMMWFNSKRYKNTYNEWLVLLTR